jgi:hypothetical protein
MATEIPEGFEFSGWQEEATWDWVTIAGAAHLLPVSAGVTVHYSSGGAWRVDLQYSNHRQFKSSTNVHFD